MPPRRGCGAAIGSCWSTSSRTPTRCSGRSSQRAFGAGGVDAGADRRPQAGDLCLPRRRRLRVPGGRSVRRHAGDAAGQPAQRPALLDAYDALFGDAKLGHAGIEYRQVLAAPTRTVTPRLLGRALVGGRCGSGSSTASSRRSSSQRRLRRSAVGPREHVAEDVAADIVALLSSGASIEIRADDGSAIGTEPVKPGAHRGAGPPHRNAGLSTRRSTRRRGSRRDQRRRQRVRHRGRRATGCGCSRPSSGPPTRRGRASAALTPLIGWSAERVALAERGRARRTLHHRLHRWAARAARCAASRRWPRRSRLSEGLAARVLGVVDGERELTDLQPHRAAAARRRARPSSSAPRR